MDYNDLADKILADAGSLNNVNNALHCMTRVRISVKNKDKVNPQLSNQVQHFITNPC
ncbi:PTS transporter subunit EIIB [Lacticaseibacillus paracasei]|jgi:phosphotransferase system IIB component|uniref:PTS transporter subunit EIIB n=1 Tax=Lacticaseibacillus paracasei TaxID=1597 RepID=UPI000FF03499|nr:PTS transporter subunit EIIB [Lacticaseibacillus paracasei]QPC26323.1 PTS transporter subunit EIIB [Lacticaseibacillus paracasei subsp. tolerans]QPC29261.1 PTS transporter subunit EIIB [Lacticaseibacillus paracasei subsp. tolerans]RNE45940.1 PTS system cellobiose/arbutin/salicin-specific transporter subunits IIBC [Lacticaseibacillus paracasei]